MLPKPKGTDAAIDAVHHNPKGMRGRVTVIKLLASAATIGSGGSAGREGPTAQIRAGFGSLLARRLSLSPQDARIAVTVGIGSGIGAIFRAPLGDAVLGTEILYRYARGFYGMVRLRHHFPGPEMFKPAFPTWPCGWFSPYPL